MFNRWRLFVDEPCARVRYGHRWDGLFRSPFHRASAVAQTPQAAARSICTDLNVRPLWIGENRWTLVRPGHGTERYGLVPLTDGPGPLYATAVARVQGPWDAALAVLEANGFTLAECCLDSDPNNLCEDCAPDYAYQVASDRERD